VQIPLKGDRNEGKKHPQKPGTRSMNNGQPFGGPTTDPSALTIAGKLDTRKILAGIFVAAVLFFFSYLVFAEGGSPPLLLRNPSISKTQIVFTYGGDLWVVGRSGGDARRLTSTVGEAIAPSFSPDGTMIAFTGEYNGNRNVFVVPAAGGVPRQLTFQSAEEDVLGWTPDGKNILYKSGGNSFLRLEDQLYTVPLGGGFPTQLPIPIAAGASFSPDGVHLAYVPHRGVRAWMRYRGGRTTPIWIADLRDSSTIRIPRDNSNDHDPMWAGDTVYFLSDRNGPVSLFAYDTNTKLVSEALRSDGFDFKTAKAGPDAIVIEQFGAIKSYDLTTHLAKNVSIHVAGDFEAFRPHFAKVDAKDIQHFGISPTGARAVFEAWGEIFTVPTDKGAIRNLTHSPAVADRDPAWSPDGKSIAYFSDESGEYELCIRAQNGLGEVRHINLGSPPSFFYTPRWSPDSKKIAYFDKRLNLWYVDVDNPKPKLVDTDYYGGYYPSQFDQTWSPDSRWIAYQKQLPNRQHAVFIYSLEQATCFQVSDGMSDALYPAFDKNGRYLYFTASTDIALSTTFLDMTSFDHPVTRSVYVVVLRKDEKSPLAPQSDEEEAKAERKADHDKDAMAENHAREEKQGPIAVKIDFDRIGQRILSLPIPARNYTSLQPGKSGILFLAEGPMVVLKGATENLPRNIQRFDLSKRKVEKLLDEVNDYTVSFDGEKILYRKDHSWAIASGALLSSSGNPMPGIVSLKLDDWQVYVEPRPMWKQIYNETWRLERDFFYDPHYHGLDLEKAKKKYALFIDGLASRSELTYLLEECLGELSVSHISVGGGEQPETKKVKVGFLGADYALENGRYRFAKIYDGENWTTGMEAPLTQPGLNVNTGDYILAVNGLELHSSDNIYHFFEETAGKQVVLKIGSRPDGKESREVTVVPIDSEEELRYLAWIDNNRHRVDEATGGRVAYVYMPDTSADGYSSFNRYFFSQVGKEAVIIDERFNGGGQLADYVIDYLRRPIMSKLVTREGHDWSSPSEAIYGPKVMLINEMSGSGGDVLPWYFRKAGLGPLIGKRTWGGMVGTSGYPELIDGGYVTAPRAAIYGLDGEWEVENHGVVPDYEVDLDPAMYRRGRDSQLEKAIEIVTKELNEHPLPRYKRPPYPNYHQHDALGNSTN
jgi:tricorn protease